MPLNIDGKEIQLSDRVGENLSKSDVNYTWANAFGSNEKVVFSKKGSELKGILYEKKRVLEDEKALSEKKMAILKEELGERKSGSREGEVDNIENNISYELTDDSVENATEEEKLSISAYKKCAYRCMAIKSDLKTINTLIKHLEDDKSYKVNLAQMQSIEKAEQNVDKTSSEAQDKVEKVMSEFKAGTLKDSQGNKVSDRKQAIAIAMSEAGITSDDIEKFYPTGKPPKDEQGETITKNRRVEKGEVDVASRRERLEKALENKDTSIEKGDVKGHYRTTKTGKKVFVKQHTDKRTKKEGEESKGGKGVSYDEAIKTMKNRLKNSEQVKQNAKNYGKSVDEIVRALEVRINVKRNDDKSIKSAQVNFTPSDKRGVAVKELIKFNKEKESTGGDKEMSKEKAKKIVAKRDSDKDDKPVDSSKNDASVSTLLHFVNKTAQDKTLTAEEKKIKIAEELEGNYGGKTADNQIKVYRSPNNRTLLAVKGKYGGKDVHRIDMTPDSVLNAIENIQKK